MLQQGLIHFRVRYVECDPMGFLHHSAYLPYFEMGRTELLRSGAAGVSYKDMEEQGFFLVVAKISVNFRKPARYDDELELLTRVARITPVRIEHQYELYHHTSRLLLCTAESTLACIGRDGHIRAMPEIFLNPA